MNTVLIIRTDNGSQHHCSAESIQTAETIAFGGETWVICDGPAHVNVRHIVSVTPTWK